MVGYFVLQALFLACTISPCLAKDSPPGSIKLPKATHKGLSLEKAIKNRRSTRTYTKKPVTLDELSQLLYSAQGITGKSYGTRLRAAPSAGALYPMNVYVFARNIKGLAPGLYLYKPQEHSLDLIRAGDLSNDVMKAGLKQPALKKADLVFALSAVPDRMNWKYGNRTMRYIHIEAGHIAQNVLLQAVSLGLGAGPIGAFTDKKLNRLLGIDGKSEVSVYLVAVGTVN
jgi:SagB-type dehydrogenase family enzyme